MTILTLRLNNTMHCDCTARCSALLTMESLQIYKNTTIQTEKRTTK